MKNDVETHFFQNPKICIIKKPRCNEKKKANKTLVQFGCKLDTPNLRLKVLHRKETKKKFPNWPTSLPQSDKLLVCDMLATVQFEAFHHTVLTKLYIPSTIKRLTIY